MYLKIYNYTTINRFSQVSSICLFTMSFLKSLQILQLKSLLIKPITDAGFSAAWQQSHKILGFLIDCDSMWFLTKLHCGTGGVSQASLALYYAKVKKLKRGSRYCKKKQKEQESICRMVLSDAGKNKETRIKEVSKFYILWVLKPNTFMCYMHVIAKKQGSNQSSRLTIS